MISTYIVQHSSLFHLPLSDLRSDWYLLSGCEIKAEFKRNWRVFDRDSTNTCRIANRKAGGESTTKTAQSTYWTCCDMIRTQILNWSKKCWLLRSGFCVETRCNSSVSGWNRTRNRPGNLDPLLTLSLVQQVHVIFRWVITPIQGLLNPIRQVVLPISHTHWYPPYCSHLPPPSLSFSFTTLSSS